MMTKVRMLAATAAAAAAAVPAVVLAEGSATGPAASGHAPDTGWYTLIIAGALAVASLVWMQMHSGGGGPKPK